MNPPTADVVTEDPTSRAGTRRAPSGRRRRPAVPTLILAVCLVAYGAWLVHSASGMWFWIDDYEFLIHRGTIPGLDHGLFEPHNGHWSTMVVLVYRVLFAAFGMTTYVPYVLVTIVIHLAIAALLYTLLCREGANRWAALLASWFVVFIPIGFDNILWDAAMNNTGALLFGFLAVLALSRAGFSNRSVAMAWALLVVALMFSGTGVSAVVLAAAFAGVSRGPLVGLKVASVPAAVFVVWFLAEGRHANSLEWSLTQVPQFVWTGLTGTLGKVIGVETAGPVLFVCLLAALLTDRHGPEDVRHLAWAGLLAATTQLFLEALTRGFLGADLANSGRYAYFTVVLLTPAFGLLINRIWHVAVEPRWVVAVIAVVLAAGHLTHSLGALSTFAEGWRGVTSETRGFVLATSENVADGQLVVAPELTGPYEFIDVEALGREDVRRRLPDIEVSAEDRLRSETELNIGVSPDTYELFRPVLLDLTSGWKEREAALGPGCQAYTATRDDPLIQIATQDGTEIGITSEATQVVTVLQRDDVQGPVRIWGVRPGAIHIAVTARDAVLKISFNAGGEYTICKQ
ncbi:hypothetical protein Q9S36_41365 [Microbacterium sp. ARD31]|uniref:hypothetical protein n=1 Tax=Microbacterium sp. ARD31 TaxID=2962576 RepID=UPI002880C806|nr:hypothetical protein [Microbacterium sp. ARD31]MDT0186655.1 hypothetical protein [Microbacterium sp. ARD31]